MEEPQRGGLSSLGPSVLETSQEMLPRPCRWLSPPSALQQRDPDPAVTVQNRVDKQNFPSVVGS